MHDVANIHAESFRIDYSNFASGQLVIEALNGGALDFGNMSEIPPVFAAASTIQSFKQVAVLHGDVNNQVVLVPKDSAVTSLADLKGKRVGYVQATTSQYFLVRMLESVGLTWSDIPATPPMGVSDGLAAFSTGQLDAWAIYGFPIQRVIATEGARILKTARGFLSGNYIVSAHVDALADPAKSKLIGEYRCNDIIVILAQESLIGLTVAPQYGGRGAGLVESLRVLGAVAKGEPSTALISFMTYGFYAQSSRGTRWPAPVFERLVQQAAAGGGLIGGPRIEPELGTPVRGGLPKTVARRTADGWAITGSKIYSTGSTGLTWFSVWAKTDEAEPRVGNFLVAADSPGIRIVPAWDHLGMRATVSHEVVFEGTPIPAEHAVDVRQPADWAPTPGDHVLALSNALAISTIYDGIAQAARDWLRTYLKERVPANLGASLATLPRVQEKFGEIEALLYTNRLLLQNAAERSDEGRGVSAVEANNVKYIVTSNAIRAVEIGLELTGNPSLSRKNPLERHYRDVLCSRIHSPQNDTILVAAGRAGFGLR